MPLKTTNLDGRKRLIQIATLAKEVLIVTLLIDNKNYAIDKNKYTIEQNIIVDLV
jgi:hypothetical protein